MQSVSSGSRTTRQRVATKPGVVQNGTVNPSSLSALQIAQDPNWLAHRYDPELDSVHFLRTPRDVHRRVTFITDEYLPKDGELRVIRRGEAMAAAPPPGPVHFIFHSAYCCSTLLARAFDIEGVSMGLKEPVILNDLIGWRHRGGEPRRIAEVLDHSLALLARPFSPGEAVVIKPSNVTNGLMAGMLAMRPEASALLLYAPLETYLGSIAKKGMWGRLWVRELLVKLLKGGLVDLGFTNEQYLGLTDIQAAAVGWVAQHAQFAGLIERFGEDRVRTLDSETLVARPYDSTIALSKLYRLGLGAAAIQDIVSGPAFSRHSKSDSDFGRDQRAAEQRDAAVVHGDEIEKVTKWAEVVAANAGVSLELAAPLVR